MNDLIYCYPDSDVLINKLNIHDSDKLREAERSLTMLRIMDLLDNPIKGNFDLAHLQSIHQYIFQDIYLWAGKIRSVDIAKSNMFCRVQFIEPQAAEIFEAIRKEQYLVGLDRDLFVKRAAYYFSEVNALHPFREGNGRTQREFFRQLAHEAGYMLQFASITEKEMVEASDASFRRDYQKMELLFKKILI